MIMTQQQVTVIMIEPLLLESSFSVCFQMDLTFTFIAAYPAAGNRKSSEGESRQDQECG